MNSQLGYSVVNLSKLHLTKGQVQALEKGITFCPTHNQPGYTEIWNDLEECFRRLRIKCHFDGIIKEEDPNNGRFKSKRQWTPSQWEDLILDTFIKTIKTDVIMKTVHKPEP